MLLGLCCGLGLYLDSMFVLTLAAIALAGLAAEISASLKDRKGLLDENPAGKRRFQFTRGLALILAFLAGASPRMISQRVEPYDAYHEQFSWSCNLPLLAEHGRILGLECLPRLIAGHRLPGLEADPDPALLGTGGPIQKTTMSREGLRAWTLLLVILALALLASALLALGATAMNGQTSAARIVAAGMLALVVEVAGGFLVNRNIFNADNYRYLVLLLIPWAIGCGLVLQQAIRTGGPAQVNALAVLVVLAVLFTCDVVAWYRRLGWVDERLVPVGRKVDDPAMRLAGQPSRNRFDLRRLLGRLPDLLPERRESPGRSLADFPEPVSRMVAGATGRASRDTADTAVFGGADVLEPGSSRGWESALPGRWSDHRELAMADCGAGASMISVDPVLSRPGDPALRSGRGRS